MGALRRCAQLTSAVCIYVFCRSAFLSALFPFFEFHPNPIVFSFANSQLGLPPFIVDAPMSDSKQNDAQRSVASHTREQTHTQARDEEDDKEQPVAQLSSHVSPAMRIYRHALESILGMLELNHLSHVLAVS